MWIKPEDILHKIQPAESLIRYKENTGEALVAPRIDYRKDCTVIHSSTNWLDVHYENVEDCVCDNIYIKDGLVQVVTEDTMSNMSEMYREGWHLLQTYGVTDVFDDTEKCFDNLFEQYPDLKILGTDVFGGKFALTLQLVDGGFRFHKNGGYRGKDEVGEHVSDSPSEEYLMFCLVRIVGNKL